MAPRIFGKWLFGKNVILLPTTATAFRLDRLRSILLWNAGLPGRPQEIGNLLEREGG
jgi:hypothetical protein